MDLIAEFKFMIDERFKRFVEVICEGYDGLDADYLHEVWADICAEKIDYYGEGSDDESECDTPKKSPVKKSPIKKSPVKKPVSDSESSDSEPESPVKKAKPTGASSKSPVKKSPPKKPASDSESSDSEPETPVKKSPPKSPVKSGPKQCEYVFKSGPNKGEQCETKCKEGSLCGKHKKSEEEPKSAKKPEEPKSAKKPEEPKSAKKSEEPKSAKKPEPKKPVESDSESDSDSEPVTVPKQIAIRLNKTIGKYWHEATALVFRSASDRVVVGRLVGTKIVKLRPDDITNCKDQGFKYDPACVAEDEDEAPKSPVKTAQTTGAKPKSPILKTGLLSKIGKLGDKKDEKKTTFQKLAKEDEKKEDIEEEEDEAVEDIEDVLDEIQEEDDE